MHGNRGCGTGGHWGQVPPPPHLLYLGKKCPFSGMKVPYFHGIEVLFLQNLSALFGQCPLTFEVLLRPLHDNKLQKPTHAKAARRAVPDLSILFVFFGNRFFLTIIIGSTNHQCIAGCLLNLILSGLKKLRGDDIIDMIKG